MHHAFSLEQHNIPLSIVPEVQDCEVCRQGFTGHFQNQV